MKRLSALCLVLLMLTLAACAPGAPATSAPAVEDTAAPSDSEATQAPAPEASPTPANEIQADVPIFEGALNMVIKSGGNFISYETPPSTVKDVTTWYQQELEAQGWERINKTDSGFGDSITLLRKKPDQTISVTLQSIAGSENVRVQITLSPK
jgi:hypothetical protein